VLPPSLVEMAVAGPVDDNAPPATQVVVEEHEIASSE
jgi:hypothetical protein